MGYIRPLSEYSIHLTYTLTKTKLSKYHTSDNRDTILVSLRPMFYLPLELLLLFILPTLHTVVQQP